MSLVCLVAMDRRFATSTLLGDAVVLIEVWLAVYAFYLVLCVVHELGHWLMGIACGFRTEEFRVSCVRWRDGWGLEWSVWNMLSGWVRMQITRPDDMVRLRRLLFVGAGPAANVLFAMMLYPLATHRSTLGGVATYLLVGSLLIAFVNLVPMEVGRLRNDGRHIFDTLFDRKGFEAVRFQARLAEAAPRLRQLKDDGDWTGLKQLAGDLLNHSEEMRGHEDVLRSLHTLVVFAEAQIVEMAETSTATDIHEVG